MIAEESVYKIGSITRTHGVKGEVAFTFTDDVWDRAEADYLILRVDGILVPFFPEEYRFRSDTTALLKFQGYDDAGSAAELCGCEVYFPYELIPEEEPEQGDYTWRFFTGFTVIDEEKGKLGTISQVDDSTANILFEVGGHYIPAAEEFTLEVNRKSRTIRMRLPEGLLDL